MKARTRRKIPARKFVYAPGTKVGGKHGKYPIDTPKRARAALAYSARADTAGSHRTVAAAVARRYPNMTVTK